MKLPPIPFLVLDTETTGFVPKVHRVIEYAAVGFADGKRKAEFSSLISHGGDIPPAVQVLTAIKPEDLVGKPTFAEALPKISEMIGDGVLVVGQNVQFDIGMLKGEGWDLSAHPWIDTSMLASLVFPELQSYSLGFLSDVLGLKHEPRHRAMGDVCATSELLSKCWERLLELPDDLATPILALAERSSPGYKILFAALAKERTSSKKRPAWLKPPPRSVRAGASTNDNAAVLARPQSPSVALIEETTDPAFLERLLHAAQQAKGRCWVGVKNLEATLRRVSLPEGIAVLYPPEMLLRPDAQAALLAQPVLTADELTLAAKLLMYTPNSRSEVPMHGGEYDVWNGKLACTRESPEYLKRIADAGQAALIDHQQLLRIVDDEKPILDAETHVVLDDASMLEDTATYAYGWECSTDSLRAAAQGHELLTKCADLIELWMEKTRSATDVRYITQNDLQSPEAKGLYDRVQQLMTTPDVPPPALERLRDLEKMLDVKNLPGRIQWIELYQDRTLHLKSVPEDIAVVLKRKLYDRNPVSLLVPPGMTDALQPILPHGTQTTVVHAQVTPETAVDVEFPEGLSIPGILADPQGKTVLLLGSKRIIEDLYVKYFSAMEAKGVALFCLGFGGGQGRMQAEFAAAKAPAFLLTTHWSYETFELPAGTVDRMYIQTLPFDHPHHPVISRRAGRWSDPFREYSLPRTKARIFRLLRTFCRHRLPDATATIMDDRLRTKPYGRDIIKYLLTLAGSAAAASVEPVVAPKKAAPKKGKKADDQLSLL